MTLEDFQKLVLDIVATAQNLKDKYTQEHAAPVNYACVFSQNEAEYAKFLHLAQKMGSVVQETAMGPVFQITPLETIAGKLHLLKIRNPDPKRPERGDADFTVSDYATFKKNHLEKDGFRLITRPEMEMLELQDPDFKVLAYFSHPTLAEVLRVEMRN